MALGPVGAVNSVNFEVCDSVGEMVCGGRGNPGRVAAGDIDCPSGLLLDSGRVDGPPGAFGAGRLSIDRTPCSLLLLGIEDSGSSARGAFGASGGGLAGRAFGACVTAFGAVGAFGGGSGLPSAWGLIS